MVEVPETNLHTNGSSKCVFVCVCSLPCNAALLTTGVAGEAFALAGGGVVWKQRVLLVVAVDGARGDDVVLVFVHQGQFGVVSHCMPLGDKHE